MTDHSLVKKNDLLAITEWCQIHCFLKLFTFISSFFSLWMNNKWKVFSSLHNCWFFSAWSEWLTTIIVRDEFYQFRKNSFSYLIYCLFYTWILLWLALLFVPDQLQIYWSLVRLTNPFRTRKSLSKHHYLFWVSNLLQFIDLF